MWRREVIVQKRNRSACEKVQFDHVAAGQLCSGLPDGNACDRALWRRLSRGEFRQASEQLLT
jgi:hypothetical protein